MTKSRLNVSFIVVVISALLLTIWGCSSGNKNTSDSSASQTGEKVKLTFMYWGSSYEKKAIEDMITSFNKSHPTIEVKGEHIAGDFNTKINTLMASNELPDMAYLDTPLALQWGKEGKLLDFTPYLENYPELNNRIPQSKLSPEPGKSIGTTIAGANMQIFYNKDLFAEAGLEPPPTKGEDAWSWDEFLINAKKLTKDKNGKHPDEAGFDPDNIVQYAFSFPTWYGGWYPFLLSNGGDMTDKDGKKYMMNSPEAVESFQALQDLIYKYHVSPTPTQTKNMPNTNVRLQTKKVAMVLDGAWALLDVSQTKMNFGLTVLPKFKEPKTIFTASAAVIFKTTKHPDEIMQFYLYYNNPEVVNLFSNGLWMPIESKYYTEQDSIDKWTKNDTHPPEFKEAAIDYLLHFADTAPQLKYQNFLEIDSKLEPALDQIWTGKKSAKEVLDGLEKTIQPMLKGKYSEE